ncbi:MAG: hypothetical protein JWR69_4280 [Pedosphaera sp.]|nr:hypothetical protein [Pedosphaera sp.]
MKPRFFALVGILLFVGLCVLWFANYYAASTAKLPAFSASDYRRDVEQPPLAIPAALDPSSQIRLAIGSLGLPDDTQNRQLGDLVIAKLTSVPGLDLVERQALDTVLHEAELSLSGLVRAKDAVRVGKLLRADWFLLGTIGTAGGSNAIVARLVEARTGIMRDVAVFPFERMTPELAARLGDFVRQCREGGVSLKPREYLAIGTFRDLSVNSRQADLPSQLRARLLSTYQASEVTLLEREYMDTLLNEVRLDLAGLTEDAGTNPVPRLQPAFWLVDGDYQSYERSGFEVEVELRLHRIFGHGTNIMIREPSGEVLFKKVKSEIDAALRSKTAFLVPTKMSEVRFQLQAGAELAGSRRPFALLGASEAYTEFTDEHSRAVIERNVQEATRAFETVLLLDPTNREAKVSLAWCFRRSPNNRVDEAREYYRQVIEEGGKDHWLWVAKTALADSFPSRGAGEERERWWNKALVQSTNPAATVFFRTGAAEARRDAVIQSGQGSESQTLAEEHLLEILQRFDKGEWYSSAMGMDDFVNRYGTNRAAAVQRLGELLPRMKAAASNSIPYLLATLVTYQEDTNAPVVAEFEKALDWCVEHPKQLQRKINPLWNHIGNTVSDWSLEHKAYGLRLKILEAKIRFAEDDGGAVDFRPEDEDRMSLAFTYEAAQRWKEALQVFESWSNQPVPIFSSGPWGRGPTVVRTSKAANYCRRQLGLPEVHDPREFDLENTGICFCGNGGGTMWLTKFGTFAAAADGLWIANTGRLLALDFDLRTNLVINLPVNASIPITTVCLGSSNIWIATGGAGLIEYDKTSQQCHLLTEKDGLLMDHISSLELSGNVLWIGYGERSSGGLGRLELPSRRVTSFAVSLADSQKAGGKVSRSPVVSLAVPRDGEVWVTARREGVMRYRSHEDIWEPVQNLSGDSCLLEDHGRLFVGSFLVNRRFETGLGISTPTSKDGEWRRFPAVEGLPKERVTTLSVDGANLWVGGMGYVALVDPGRDKMLKFSYIKCGTVDKIQTGGGFVWAQLDWHLYKARLN